MDWHRRGMPKALRHLKRLGLKPAPSELPPVLGWESPLWDWYGRLCRQWRVGALGPVGIDLGVWLPVIKDQGWDMATALELLAVIEDGYMAKRDENEGKSNDTRQ